MFIVALYRRLTGTDDVTAVEEERLLRNLNGMAKSNQELVQLGEELSSILVKVDEQRQKQATSKPSGASGEHIFDLPAGVQHVAERRRRRDSRA